MAELIRELFIGLGGTGGKTLRLLYNQMNEEQKKTAKYVFIDLDHEDVDKMEIQGIRSIAISNADVVRQCAASLGAGDGVTEWLPNGSAERIFLNSRLDDGAGQCRFKSRLCLARFFKEGAPGVKELLEEMTRPGKVTEENRLRVVIVSSIAGGTGSGTFIQMALYIRRFYRDLNQQPEIIGIFACPDLFADLADSEIEKISMFANAYASIRELNAMNLATNSPEDPRGIKTGGQVTKKTPVKLRGYGSKINMKIKTRSEGVLFDSTDLNFQMDESAKPYDLIYFIDKANEKGGILRDIHEYYRIMADIAYTRLYSPMNGAIASGESNEMRNHTLVPTAIYGSAGFARILYPYSDILRYLSENKLSEELGNQWLYFDSLWDAECQMEQEAARAYGGRWSPKPGQRGRKYQDDLNTELRGEKSRFAFLKSMIYGKGNVSKVHAFSAAIAEEAKSLSSALDEGGSAMLPADPSILRASGGKYSVLRDSEVVRMLTEMSKLANTVFDEDSGDGNLFSSLLNISAQVENSWSELANALVKAVKTQSQKLSSAVLPLTDIALANHDRTSPISLHYALLSRDGVGDVHPLAARYLLYGMQEMCLSQGAEDKNALRDALDRCIRKIRLALDDDLDDAEDIDVAMRVEEISSKRFMLHKTRENMARDMFNDFCTELKANLVYALSEADQAVVRGAFAQLKEPISEMVSLYEGFFRTIQPYKNELDQIIATDLNRHNGEGNQTIYVGASAYVKKAYTVEPSVVGALSSDPDATHAAIGAGVFDNLYVRLRRRLKDKALARDLGESAPELSQEQFNNMGEIFQSILDNYVRLLDKNATILKTNAVGALVNQICAELGVSKADVVKRPETRNLFDCSFRDHMADLKAKARPLIRYNETNSQNYFMEEVENHELNVSKTYCHFGLSPSSSDDILRYYSNSEKDNNTPDRFSAFKSKMGLRKDEKLVANDQFNDNEIFCFNAVHCLQPTQIYHFLEEQQEDSYYPCYMARVTSGLESDSPHLDKRWNQHSVMPYISANLELQWRRTVMKALIYEFLRGNISFTVGRNNAKFFVRQENDSIKFISWPKGEQILTRNVSRLVEYLSDDEETIVEEAERLGRLVNRFVRDLSNYADTPQLYKQGMTKDRLLTLLRTDLVSFLQTDKAVKSGKSVSLEEEEASVDIESTLGGVLHVAYMMHASEERLGEDKDYGEALLAEVAEIVDAFAVGMHGSAHVGGNSDLHKEYVEIYNWAIDKFFADWLKRAKVEMGADDEPEAVKPAGVPARARYFDDEEEVMTTRTGSDDVPAKIQRSPEYIWIKNNWKHKGFQDE